MNKSWPSADLEPVKNCPICGSSDRAEMYSGLTDRVFRVAGGKWSMYRCQNCSCAYLDPRPNPSSIGRAYANYYTHKTPSIMSNNGGGRKFRILLRSILNGYSNYRYQLKKTPNLYIGRWLVPLIPPFRSKADCEMRHIPIKGKENRALLDVGCGNGNYLLLAREAGWSVEGVDFDLDAVNTARDQGLDVQHGGIEVVLNQDTRYDVVTLSHVIEHVYDPIVLLRKIKSVLKPGGMLWIETPNIDSRLSKKYGSDWRGLEPPRHLVLFTPLQLKKILLDVGFKEVKQHWNRSAEWIEIQSKGIRSDFPNVYELEKTRLPFFYSILCDILDIVSPDKREFISFVAKV